MSFMTLGYIKYVHRSIQKLKSLIKIFKKMIQLIEQDLKYFVIQVVPRFSDADPASVAFRRVHNLNEDNITIVKQMPRGLGFGQQGGLQPTIAVITSQYFEKVAVDAVMTNKQTFVRYATVGKTINLY